MNKTFNAIYDGRVIVPDEPLPMQPNTPLRVTVSDKDDSDIIVFQPKTQFVKDLILLREKALQAGIKTKSREEILRDLAEERGDADSK